MCNKTEDLIRIKQITEEQLQDYTGMVKQVASEYRKKYPMVERDDIEQQLWLWFLEHPHNFNRYTTDYSQKDSDKIIAKCLRNQALAYCVSEKAKIEGYNPNDNFWYTKDFVKLLIPGVLIGNWEKLETAMSNMGRSTKAPSESGDWMAFGADIRKAFDKLDEREQNLVFLFYAQDMDASELHEKVSEDRPTAKATAMAANRALNKMVNLLGGLPPVEDSDEEN